jgi:hypothetical protein
VSLHSAWALVESAQLVAIDAAITEMESTGFLLDADYCDAQAARARVDEAAQLDQLAGWIKERGFEVFPDGVEERYREQYEKVLRKKVRLCECGERPCRKRGAGHARFEGVEESVVIRERNAVRPRPPTEAEERGEIDALWSSPVKLRRFLHSDAPGALNLPPSPVWKKGKVKLHKGEVKIDEVALDWLASRFPAHRERLKWLINLRRIRGSIKYLTKLPTFVAPDGRVHPVCGPAGDDDDRVGAVTGRLAMKNPEGQQIPRNKKKDRYGIRRAFIAGPGNVLIVADYSALEVVILAHLCKVLFGDTQLEEMTRPGGPDIHSSNARKIFGELLGWVVDEGYPDAGKPVAEFALEAFKCDEDSSLEHPYAKWLRDLVKTVWYGLQYGKGAYGFGNTLLGPDGNPIGEERAGQIVEGLLDAVPALRMYQEWVRSFIEVHHGIPALDGRWCSLTDGRDWDELEEWEKSRAWRRALNFPMQSGGAAIVGAAMVAVVRDPWLRAHGFRLILQVHDELVLEGPEQYAAEAVERVKALMVGCFLLSVPLQVTAHAARNWMEAK